jgi:hypothetical protein
MSTWRASPEQLIHFAIGLYALATVRRGEALAMHEAVLAVLTDD